MLTQPHATAKLPNRRMSDNGTLHWVSERGRDPIRFYVALGYVEGHPHPLEIFAKGPHAGSETQHTIDVACMLASYALRGGSRLGDLVSSLCSENDRATCAIDAILKFAVMLEAQPDLGIGTDIPIEIYGS